MKLLNACMYETLRFTSPVAMLTERLVIKPFTICGVKISKGSKIGVFTLGANSRDDFYVEPSKFNPDRYLASEDNSRTVNGVVHKQVPRTMFLPFGRGSRNCVGQYLGQMMVKVVVSELLRSFKFSKASENYKINLNFDPVYGITNSILNIEQVK